MKMKFFASLSMLMLGYFTCAQNLMHPLVGQTSYLSDLKMELQKKWPENQTVNLVFHGHSVPAGYFKTPVVETLDAYPHQLIKKLKEIYPNAVINAIVTAIGGENSVTGASRFMDDVLTHDADVLFVDYALNDRGIGLDLSRAAWSQMIRQAKERQIKVILLTPSPDQRVDYSDPDNELKQHTEQIAQLAEENQVGLVDNYRAFEFLYSKKKKLRKYISQVNHPNRRGHELIADEILKWFK